MWFVFRTGSVKTFHVKGKSHSKDVNTVRKKQLLALHLAFLGSFCSLVVSVCIPVDKLTNVGDLSFIGEHALAFLPQSNMCQGAKVYICKMILAF